MTASRIIAVLGLAIIFASFISGWIIEQRKQEEAAQYRMEAGL